jgi:hypothetical protein
MGPAAIGGRLRVGGCLRYRPHAGCGASSRRDGDGAASWGSSAAMTLAVTSIGPRISSTPSTSEMRRCRRLRRARLASYRSPWSVDTAASTAAHAERNPRTPSVTACSSSDASARGSALAAAVIASICAPESDPARKTASVSDKPPSRSAVSMVAFACPTVVPVTVANHAPASRCEPSPIHAPVCAIRPAANVLPAPASRSSSANFSTSSFACSPLSTAGSRVATITRSDSIDSNRTSNTTALPTQNQANLTGEAPGSSFTLYEHTFDRQAKT